MRDLLIEATASASSVVGGDAPPTLLVQFWDDAAAVPPDVQACIDSWMPLEHEGFRRLLFDDMAARRFIGRHLGSRHLAAFSKCRHPAMRADYFRLCFMLKIGGLYVDADDVYRGCPVGEMMGGGCLKVQPLCYDISNQSMVDPLRAAGAGVDDGYIFYVNNNPLIAPPHHPLVDKALDRATSALLLSRNTNDRDIQALTGPGNLTAALVAHAIEARHVEGKQDFVLLAGWDAVARSEWHLAYRSDWRNWRHWAR